ncbi:Ubiquitin carboxyl-terminal hydrolase YUH1 [Sparassis crispa]|uniref:Ubiquitin carboxyl-terminal hydrolase n=1 Tax=Sparassis crispa TaxID=139825 RepID=A0A401GPA7_9APHY|nr:Ubiquitin carboxyl-terminal hydrolase YUH1 [Sparassis crispa]GBE83594.1 Ubiquitin carboxyl-terminal hydrolase YUH1 [Sparassis crispa]
MFAETTGPWIPLESNPEVLNRWANQAGLVASQAQFEDVYGLDPDLLALVSQPVKAVVLLFPITDGYEEQRKLEDARIVAHGQHPVDPTIFWMKQTISNACGTMGIIHAVANSDVTLAPESPLAEFIEECQTKTPEERAKTLETTPLFAKIHSQAATTGQSAVPTDLNTNLHFTCFVKAPDPPRIEGVVTNEFARLIELDGRRAGPVDRGICTDLLQDVARFVKDCYVSQTASMQFSMLSLGPPQAD